jgi:ADP-L-glycero-D-manno-heptose 6-epimerase
MIMGDVGTVDAVIHMGACSTTTERDADYLFDNNFRYSTEVAEFALEAGARFIYASSAATYGDGSRGYSDRDSNLRPLNMYGYSKHLFDGWIREQGLEDRVVGLKFFNVFGPNEYHKGDQASMVYKAAKQILSHGSVKLFRSNAADYRDGEQKRDFVYVKDVVSVMQVLLERTDVNGIFNLGSGVARSWNDVANGVFAAMATTPSIEYIPIPESIAGQYQNFTQADMSTLLQALPDVTFRSLEESIADYVSGHLSQEWPFL